jgi:hypothetical protein
VRLGVGAKLEMETPVNPVVVTLTVGPNVVREMEESAARALQNELSDHR